MSVPSVTADSGHDAQLAMLRDHPRAWLVTGGAGFIGSHLVQRLLELGQRVRVLDDLSTGSLDNLREAAGGDPRRVDFVRGGIGERGPVEALLRGTDIVLHQAARGSVPRSLKDPAATFQANVAGFHFLLDAARSLAQPPRVVFASSSSVYGADPEQPRREPRLGAPLSPYAASKQAGEVLAQGFWRSYGLECVALRYFNVFGPRQNPDGDYAAVIPRWLRALLMGEPATIYGDGSTLRDYCPVAHVVEANLRAALAPSKQVAGEAFNVGMGARTTLLELFDLLRDALVDLGVDVPGDLPQFAPERPGDVRVSYADPSKARLLGLHPTPELKTALRATAAWFHGGLASS